MTIFPKPERQKIPEGHYQFRLNREPEIIKFTYLDGKTGQEKEGRKIKVYAVGINATGEYSMVEQIPVWDERYADLLLSLGVEHSKDIQVEGALFEADVVHERDKTDPTKSWPRLVNIEPMHKPGKAEDGDIPF